MTTNPPSTPHKAAAFYMPPASWPNYDHIVTEDNKPVDSFYDGSQMPLLTSVLYDGWTGPGENRPYVAMANCGLFYSFNEPPIVPDVMLSLDVQIFLLPKKRQRSYFAWELGKVPDAAIEIVSGTDGDELGRKLEIYERIGVPYYIVWDPRFYLDKTPLHCYVRQGRKYEKNGTWFPQIGLGVTEWQGEYENDEAIWLRWCDANGIVLLTGGEKSAQEGMRRAREGTRRAREATRRRGKTAHRQTRRKAACARRRSGSTMTTPDIIWTLDTKRLGHRVVVHPRLDSTNSLALSLSHDPAHHGLVVIAREQTAGRGQYGRSWQAPPGSSVLMSVLLFPPIALRRPALLTAWAAVSVCETILHVANLQANIKWPNDVLILGKKICGILIEQCTTGNADFPLATVVGIGLNITQSAEMFEQAGLPDAASLTSLSGMAFIYEDVAKA